MAENPLPQAPAGESRPGLPDLQFLAAFKFLFNNPDPLINILLGAVMNLIPIIGPIVLMGWQCEIIQRLVKRHARPIPKLDFGDFLYFLGRGVAPFVVALIMSLPLILVIFVLMFGGMFAGALLESSFRNSGQNPGPLVLLVVAGAFLVFFALMLVFNIVINSALLRAELTEDIGKSLDVGKILAYAKATWKDFLIAYLVFIPLGMLVMFAGMAAFFVGIYAAIIILNIAQLHLRWQIYERYLARGGEAITIQTKSGPLPSETKVLPQPAQGPAAQ